jgi:hypothetical protein
MVVCLYFLHEVVTNLLMNHLKSLLFYFYIEIQFFSKTKTVTLSNFGGGGGGGGVVWG